MTKRHPCQRKERRVSADKLMGAAVEPMSVADMTSLEDVFLNMQAFGGLYLNRIYQILDKAIGLGVPLVITVSGPVTTSGQNFYWLNPLLDTGWFAYVTTTGAVCYHDGHRSVRRFREPPIRQVEIEGKDEEYRRQRIVRITTAGFKEGVLFDQDAFFTAMLRQPEFQHRMTGTELRHLQGKYLAAQEEAFGVRPGLLATCYRHGIPVFTPSPFDASDLLNSVKLWAHAKNGLGSYDFDIDGHADVFESCAYHYWALTKSKQKKIGILILGGGATKNYSLQPEPTLSQIFLLPNIRGYDFDVQIVGAPVTDGSVTSCKPAEAHTWGKVSLEALASTVESFQGDYSTYMPFIARALIEKRQKFQALLEKLGPRKLFKRHPEARGYLRPEGQLRLFDRRQELVNDLNERFCRPKQIKRMEKTFNFPLELVTRAAI